MKAKAKINLTLDILSKRPDGYHEISSVMQTISLCDKVKVKKAKDISVSGNSGINPLDDICYKAAKAFFEYTKIPGGAKIKIKKNIPVSAGLGGGSADAAAVICELNRIYKTNLGRECLEKIALKAGADVPFLISGGTAKVCGIGEKVCSLPHIVGKYIVLVKETEKQSTAKTYSDFDEFGKSNPKTDAFCNALNNGAEWQDHIGNDFISVIPQKALIAEITALKPACVSLSGSGPTVFAIFESKKQARNAAKSLKRDGRIVLRAEFA